MMLALNNIKYECRYAYMEGKPFRNVGLDTFVEPTLARKLAAEFSDYDDPCWHFYGDALENEKACNDWIKFPVTTYRFITFMYSKDMLDALYYMTGVRMFPDMGLHGGGWHIHGPGGNLNPHLDYSCHPKLGLQRKLNIIVYLTEDYQEEWGGHLGLWSDAGGKPGVLTKEIAPLFNRAIIFDTTQNSWHGMSRPLNLPPGKYRKSIAVYYLCEAPLDADARTRALFYPRETQLAGACDAQDDLPRRTRSQV